MRLQRRFAGLPGAVGAPGELTGSDPSAFCKEMTKCLERMRRALLPAPTVEIGLAFVTYIDALLELYRECPESRRRALELHDRANAYGTRFEALLNAQLSQERE